MSSDRDSQGTHYHYHFYGQGAPQQPYPGARPGNVGGPGGFQQGAGGTDGDPQAAGGQFPGGPFAGGPFAGGPFPGGPFAGAPGAANPHQHPTADSFVKGLLVGAGAAYLLTNETAQRTILRTAVQLWTVVQGGLEELKERLHDAEAEVASDAAATGAASASPQPAGGAGDDLTIDTDSGSDTYDLKVDGDDGRDDPGTVTISPGHRFPRSAS